MAGLHVLGDSKIASAAVMPDFIAVCVPLIFGTFRKPAVQPTRQPPRKVSFGIDWKPPSFSARAPGTRRHPRTRHERRGVLKRWFSTVKMRIAVVEAATYPTATWCRSDVKEGSAICVGGQRPADRCHAVGFDLAGRCPSSLIPMARSADPCPHGGQFFETSWSGDRGILRRKWSAWRELHAAIYISSVRHLCRCPCHRLRHRKRRGFVI